MRKRVPNSRCRAIFEGLESRRLLAVSVPASLAIRGDVNDDGTVDSADFAVMASNWGKPASSSGGDTNGDGVVDTLDFNQVTADFGKVAPPSTGDPSALPIPGNWSMIFNDEFEINPLNNGYVMNLWGQSGMIGAGTSSSNVTVNNGVLSLTATRNSSGGYTSAQIQSGGNRATGGSTSPKFGFTYGYIEARIDVPDGTGLWPAFWMLPVPNPNFHDGDGEIDIMDNGAGNPNQLNGGVITHGVKDFEDDMANLSGGFHTIGLDWQPDHMTWYVDGNAVNTLTNRALIPTVQEYFILGLQINNGQIWGPAPNSSTPFPASLNVDYVRVWQNS